MGQSTRVLVQRCPGSWKSSRRRPWGRGWGTTQRRRRKTSHNIGGHPANTKSCSLGLQRISLILDIHMMFNWQLSYQEIRWPESRDDIAGSNYNPSRSRVFWSWPLTKCWFLIGSRAHGRLTCWKQGRVVRKLVNPNPGLKFIRIITFSFIQFFSLPLCFVYMLIIKLKKSQTRNRKPHCKVTKLKSNFYFFLG